MLISNIDPDKFSRAYDILCQGLHPWEGVAEAPFAATWCVVEPGKVARAHKHQEHEAFVIVEGRGRMRVDDESREVGPGDLIFMQAFSVHELENLSTEEELKFLDLCWEVMPEAVAENDAVLSVAADRPRAVLITATPPTPNGDLHVGHLSGPYLGADIYARYLRTRGVEAHYLSGMDDHQSYVVTKGEKLDLTGREVADRFGDLMSGTLEMARIELDHIGRPHTSPYHRELVEKVFRELYESGAIVAREAPTLYCETCEQVIFEAWVSGSCPHCEAGSGGNACEACGRPNDCADLGQPSCHRCGSAPATRTMSRLYFPLEPYREKLEEFWRSCSMSPHLHSLCQQMLADGLPDIAVSHPSDWGIPVPVDGFEDQRIYVWFEMGPGFLAATRELLEQNTGEKGGGAADWKSFWGGPEHQVVQFFGFDNGYFHALLFPATFLAWDSEIRLPTALVTNEFFRYQGEKFSTSRNHAMWGRELLAEVPPDVARFGLAWNNPEREQTNFTLEDLWATVERELYQGWEPWLRQLGAKVEEHFDGALPGTGAWTDEQQRFFRKLGQLNEEAATAYEAETFSPQRAARVLSELVHAARRFGKGEEHWQGLPSRFEEWRTAVALEALAAKTLARLAAPLMPDFAAALWHDLGYDTSVGEKSWEAPPEFVPSGRSLNGLDRPHFTARA